MIFGIGGRKGCGKSTVSAELASRGFVRISFADFLKESAAKLFSLTTDSMYDVFLKEQKFDTPLIWDARACKAYSEMAGVSLEFSGYKELYSRRDVLQFLGTDVLRAHDPDFHVKKTRERLLGHPNCYVDDLRFQNEKRLIEELGGCCVFLIRPANFAYSNHSSEISVNRKDFSTVIINDGSKRKLLRKFRLFTDNLARKPSPNRLTKERLSDSLLKHEYNTQAVAAELGCSRDKIIWWSDSYAIRISRNEYKCNHDAFYERTPDAAYWAGVLSADGCVKFSGRSKSCMVVELTSIDNALSEGFRAFVGSDKPATVRKQKNGKLQYTVTVNSPFIVEDMKLWDILPRKSRVNKIPRLIANDPAMFSQWLVGLIDGDGSIYNTNRGKNISIDVLASKEVVDYVEQWIGLPCHKAQMKKVENLFFLRFSGKNAVALRNRIYQNRGLSRKWDKVVPFLDKKWLH